MLLNFKIQVQRFLSTPFITATILILSIAGRVIQLVFFYNIRMDGALQVIATQNFISGNGISMTKVLSSDLSAMLYEPQIQWPPGFSILLSPFYILFNHNYTAAGLTVSILSAVLLILVSRSILKLLEVPLYLVNLFTLLTSFFIYPFYFLCSSDAPALSFFVLAIFFTVSLLKDEKKWGVKTLGLTIALLIGGTIKYLLIPVAFIIPVFLLLKGFVNKEKRYRNAGAISFLLLVVTITSLLLYQKSISGSAVHIAEPGRGFFPENLLATYPFIPGSFSKIETIGFLIQRFPGWLSFINNSFRLLHLFGIIYIILFLIYHLRTKLGNLKRPVDDFLFLSALFTIAVSLVLAILSLRVKKETWDSGYLWTYVEEQRYYSLPIVLVHLLFFLSFSFNKTMFIKLIRPVRYLALFLLLIETSRGILFTSNRLKKINKEEYSWKQDIKFQHYADQIIKKERSIHPDAVISVASSSAFFSRRVSIYSKLPILDEYAIMNTPDSLKSGRPAVLLYILKENDRAAYSSFMAYDKKEFAGEYNGLYFYTLYVSNE